jgi:tyrosinase
MNTTGRLHPTIVDLTDANAEVVFTPAAGPTGGFGGTPAPVGSHRGGAGSQMGVLERIPHGLVHVAVGGETPPGLMTLFETAAQDPIFWLHHANLDRLWEAWLRRGAARRNPTAGAWLDAQWTFGSGSTETTLRTRDVLDPRQPPLGYRYADMPVTPTPEAEVEGEREWLIETEGRAAGEGEGRPPELVGTSEGETALGPAVTTARVRLRRPAGPSKELLEASGGAPKDVKVYLRLENVTGTRVHTSGVVVYLNVPPGGRPADFADRRAGVLPMFGVIEATRRDDRHSGSGLTTTLDITRAARALATSGQWDPAKVDVTFVPIPDARGRVEQGDVKVGRVSVFYA